MQKLVVLTGYPRSGKTCLSRFMESELGFSRLSTDDMRKEMYGMQLPDMMAYFGGPESIDYYREDARLKGELECRKIALLRDRQSVVIDSTALYNAWRWQLLQPSYGRLHFDGPLERYLVRLDVDRAELERRNREGDRDITIAKMIDTAWEEPDRYLFNSLEDPYASYGPAGRVKQLNTTSNTEEDFERAKEILRKNLK